METDQNLLNKIEDYLMGKLNEKELADFEQEMKVNVKLREEVQRFKLIHESIQFYGDENLKRKLDVIHEEVTKEKSNSTYYINLKKMIAAAAVFVFIVFSVYLLNIFDSNSPDDIYKEYYELPAINNISRGSGEHLSVAENYYKENDFENAFLAFNKEKEKNPNHLNLVFYTAICAHETGRDSTARVLFEEIIYKKHPALLDDAKWYISMNYISNNQIPDAKQYLIQLKNDTSSFYNQRATEILSSQLFSDK